MNNNSTNRGSIVRYMTLLGFLSIGTVHAQQINEKTFHLDDVVITATRTPKTLKDVPAFTRIIRSSDIQNTGATNIMQLLEYELPGIEFQMHQNERRVDMQGMKTGAILFLVDGERIATGEQSNIDYYRFPTEDIDRIEIIKGAASALYGSNAIGAVVNIITKKNNTPFTINLSSQYRSTKEYAAHLDISGRNCQFYFRSALTTQRIGGYRIDFRQDSPMNLDTTTCISFNQIIGWNPNKKMDFKFDGNLYKSKRLSGDPRLGNGFHGYRGCITGKWITSSQGVWNTSVLYDYYRKDVFNRHTHDTEKNADDTQQTFRSQYTHYFSDSNNLATGIEYIRESLFNKMQVAKTRQEHCFSIFTQHDVLLADRINILYGIRMDKYTTFGGNLSPKISLMYKWNRWRFRTSFCQGFRAPTLKELYTDFQHTGGGFFFHMKGNPQLKPEKSNNFNISAQWTHNNMDVSLIIFQSKFRNKIIEKWSRDDNGKSESMWINTSQRTTVKGLEAMIQWCMTRHLTVKTDYTYSAVNNPITLPDGTIANDVYTRPHMLIGQINYSKRLKQWNYFCSLRLKYGGAYDIPDYDKSMNRLYKEKLEGYALLTLNGSISYKKSLTFNMEVSNITGYKPKKLNFNTPLVNGRGIMLGLRYSFSANKIISNNNENSSHKNLRTIN